jgi:micrococcal nuclease
MIFIIFFQFVLAAQLKLSHCHDGDTCTFFEDKKSFKVRISGIDAPEVDQESGKQSRNFLRDLMKRGDYKLDCDGRSYDRRTCSIAVGNLDVGHEMIRNGWAWEFSKFSKGKYTQAQILAKKENLGLWKQKSPISPHCYRFRNDGKCKAQNNQYQP